MIKRSDDYDKTLIAQVNSEVDLFAATTIQGSEPTLTKGFIRSALDINDILQVADLGYQKNKFGEDEVEFRGFTLNLKNGKNGENDFIHLGSKFINEHLPKVELVFSVQDRSVGSCLNPGSTCNIDSVKSSSLKYVIR